MRAKPLPPRCRRAPPRRRDGACGRRRTWRNKWLSPVSSNCGRKMTFEEERGKRTTQKGENQAIFLSSTTRSPSGRLPVLASKYCGSRASAAHRPIADNVPAGGAQAHEVGGEEGSLAPRGGTRDRVWQTVGWLIEGKVAGVFTPNRQPG